MGMVNATQTGQDGTGKEVKVNANSITMKAKKLTAIRESTLRITGLTTGTTYAVQVVVKPGTTINPHSYPPPIEPDPPNIGSPTAGFNYSVGGSNNNNTSTGPDGTLI